ncbi:MAG: hypothetical protein WDZ50_04665 [Woeseia sp.]
MNQVPALRPTSQLRARRPARLWLALWLAIAAATGCDTSASDVAARDNDENRIYRLDYQVTVDPAAGGAWVELQLQQPAHYLRELKMRSLAGRLSEFTADGELSTNERGIVWKTPLKGGKLRWFARLDHRRRGGSYDAYIEADWALFRGEDIIPSALTRTLVGAESETRVSFTMPRGWSSVAPYAGRGDSYLVENSSRRFATPTGWIVLGKLGVRREIIDGVRVVVAGPVGQSFRRMDIVALLHWTLPELTRLLPDFPKRLTIVGAGNPMWRGALSAPRSIFVHADRPLLSENATSTIVHEAMHIGMGLAAMPGADWIVEGIAEFYSLEILRRSGTISESRFRLAHRQLAKWGQDAANLCTSRSSGSGTALAVSLLVGLDAEIREKSAGRASLDDITRELASAGEKVTVSDFRTIAERIAGSPLSSIKAGNLRGCGGDVA